MSNSASVAARLRELVANYEWHETAKAMSERER